MVQRPPPRRPRGRAGPLRWIGRGIAALAVLLVVLAAGLFGLLRTTLPSRDETLSLPALEAPVRIAFDADGVPHIAAASEHDAAVALGVLHARDRLFQMELMRRGAEGRLAELLGPQALRSDRFVRTLGLARRAAADLETLPPDARRLLEAYADGVNAWIASRGRFAAPEFLPLGAPEPWRAEHSLLWAKVMGIWLSGDWRAELDRERLAAAGLPQERIDELWPPDQSAGRPDQAIPPPRAAARRAPIRLDPEQLARLAAALPRFPEDPGSLPSSASNAWTVAPARSASGAPLLASDPHLGFQAPALWYLVRIDLPGGRMRAGATSPGVPLVVIGRNESVAWGFTTTHADTQDLFVERLSGPDAYETPDGPRPFVVREEEIPVRGRAPERLRVRETRHGPVLSDLGDPVQAAPGMVVAVAMANLLPGDTAAAGLLAVNRARSLAEVRAGAAMISSPSQNLMAADRDGHIGLFVTGRIPIRAGGDGTRPARGWDGSQDWTGFIPFAALPHVVDPASGALANANNKVAPGGRAAASAAVAQAGAAPGGAAASGDAPAPAAEGPPLSRDWPGDWRFRRIGQMLGDAPKHDAAGFQAMQMDLVSLLARDLLAPGAVLRRAPRPEGAAGTALDLLLAWDGTVAADRPEPLILAAWREAMLDLALRQAGIAEAASPGGSPEFLAFLMQPDGRGAWWCGGDCAAMASRAMTQAVDALVPRFGPDPAAWRWGSVHVARFEHPVLRHIPVLSRLTTLSAVTGGDGETVSRGGYRTRAPDRFAHVHGPSLRLVADLSDPEATLAILATGQSGNPLSPHWGDMIGRWQAGRMLRLTRAAAGDGGRLLLVP